MNRFKFVKNTLGKNFGDLWLCMSDIWIIWKSIYSETLTIFLTYQILFKKKVYPLIFFFSWVALILLRILSGSYLQPAFKIYVVHVCMMRSIVCILRCQHHSELFHVIFS